MLDSTQHINRKQELLLQAIKDGDLKNGDIILGGAVSAIMGFWNSNTANKFGYLMRHPTPNNQQGKNVSEAVIHSAQISLTAHLTDWVTTYAEVLYDPEQSFGAGTNTALTRNQLQLRKGYVLLGNLEEYPIYLTLGKFAAPFGLTDTVSPFTASTVWHAFGGLSYGAKLSYSGQGLNLSFEAAQGGAQFRALNQPNNGTSITSKLNNYVLDANYSFDMGENQSAMFGASYMRGSAYCQSFPVTHFTACEKNNPAFAVYGQLNYDNFLIQAEFAKTTEVWPGTHNTAAPLDQFAAHKVSSFSIGGKYTATWWDKPTDLSLEFSTFIAGPDGAPWKRQNQLVLGVGHYFTPSVKGFIELIQTDGYAPLNFISGGNVKAQPVGTTHSDANARSRGVILGINATF